MNERHSGGGFFNGFILGLLVGAGLVFLLGTNKGKKVLQMLLDQVEENSAISELLEIPDDEEEEMMGIEAEEEEEPEFEKVEVEKPHVQAPHEEEKPHKVTAKVKRFFKGAPKKMVS